MIYPTIGISMFIHIIVIMVAKTKNFLGFSVVKKKKPRNNFLSKIFLSLFIAVTVETVLFTTLTLSFFAIDIGITSNNSNYHIIKNAFQNYEKSMQQYSCNPSNFCYMGTENKLTDASISLS